jgi:hypothetical protein
MPVEAALARTIAGKALAQTGERDRAVQQLQQAAAELHRCGAVRYRDAAERELRQLGQHIHRRTRPGASATGVDSLTEREMQIAQLIVDRKTNGEIAGELFPARKRSRRTSATCSESSTPTHASTSPARSKNPSDWSAERPPPSPLTSNVRPPKGAITVIPGPRMDMPSLSEIRRRPPTGIRCSSPWRQEVLRGGHGHRS